MEQDHQQKEGEEAAGFWGQVGGVVDQRCPHQGGDKGVGDAHQGHRGDEGQGGVHEVVPLAVESGQALRGQSQLSDACR